MSHMKKAPVVDCCTADPKEHPNDLICKRLIKKGQNALPLCKDLVIEQAPRELSDLPDSVLEFIIKLHDAEERTIQQYALLANALLLSGLDKEAQVLSEFLLLENLMTAGGTSESDLVASSQIATCHAQACNSLGDSREEFSKGIAENYIAAAMMKSSGGVTAEIDGKISDARKLIKRLR